MSQNNADREMPFGKKNYIFLLIGIVVIFLGYFLMAQEGFIDATEFSLALYVSPPVIIAGFVICIYAVLINPASGSGDPEGDDGTA